MGKLDGKVAAITGSAEASGRGIALRMQRKAPRSSSTDLG